MSGLSTVLNFELGDNFENVFPHFITKLIFGPSAGFGLITSSALSVFDKSYDEYEYEEIKAFEAKRRNKIKPGDIDFRTPGHTLAVGTTGSGKTANILRYVERSIEREEPVIILDGKGSMAQYSLYDTTMKLAEKHNRKVYVFNQTNPNQTNPYNPFAGTTATQTKDMLLSLSEWSEDHYKNLAAVYWQAMADITIKSKQIVSFDSLTKYSNREELMELVKDSLSKGLITQEKAAYMRSKIEGQAGQEAATQAARFEANCKGDGKNLFAENGFNIRQVYAENAIVICLLNPLKFGDFARSCGKLILQDIKNLAGKLQATGANCKSLVVMDELGVYVDDSMIDLLNKTRETKIKVVAATQTTVDIDKHSPELTQQIIDNSQSFIMLRVNDNAAAEELSQIPGTRKAVEKTARSSQNLDTGESSNKIVEEMIVHPNDLKRLPTNEGFFYDKNTLKIVKFKTKFVSIN
ncbi:MAG: type IV secretion system DNA-binding domain-containing protein [Clostridiales Family XIII bacterium]|nr:type IV secretion system DNA-binding domain-containing protein [Clostridiales Family XIII bacterium]